MRLLPWRTKKAPEPLVIVAAGLAGLAVRSFAWVSAEDDAAVGRQRRDSAPWPETGASARLPPTRTNVIVVVDRGCY